MQEGKWHKIVSSSDLELNVHLSSSAVMHSDDDNHLVLYGYALLDEKNADAQQVLSTYLESSSLSDFYSRLSGQFTLVIAKPDATPVIITDQLATKPCYYFAQKQSLYVSDELRAIKSLPEVELTVSKQALYNYLYFHCIPAPTTIYQNVFKVEAGTMVSFSKTGEAHKTVAYSPEFANTLSDHNKAYQDCLNTVEKAVKKHAQGEVGAFLSGGLDSSTVSGMLAKVESKQAKTFSIGFEVAGYDETEYAMITAKHFDTDHKVLYLKPDAAAQEFVKVAQYFEEPFGNSSAMAAYFCAKFAKEDGVNVLLAGDGGDELFAGNERYAKQKVFELYFKLPKFLGETINVLFNNSLTRKIPGLKKVASYLAQARVTLPGRLQTYNFVNQLGVEAIYSTDLLKEVDTNLPLQQLQQRYSECKSDDPVDAMLYLDWKFTLADNDLVKVSKMCELADVEVRYPLLDKSLIDFSCTIPAEVKLPGSELRDFYKKACKGFLADETLTKSKHGFGLPFGAWMKENETLKTLTFETLNSFKKRNIVKESLVEQALEAHNSVHTGYFGELIWIMVVLELWLQKEASDFVA